jgi:hypothetical protein
MQLTLVFTTPVDALDRPLDGGTATGCRPTGFVVGTTLELCL